MRSSRAVWTGLILILGLTVFWLLQPVERPRSERPPQVSAPIESLDDSMRAALRAVPDLRASSVDAQREDAREVLPRELPVVARSLGASPTREELDAALWVTGRVVLPEGVPQDEDLVLVASGQAFESTGEGYRVRPTNSGEFRVAFRPRKTRASRVSIDLEANYLFLEARLRFRLDEIPDDLVLHPALGGRIRGQVNFPIGEPAVPLISDGVRLPGFAMVPVGDDGSFTFDAVPPRENYSLSFAAQGWPRLKSPNWTLEAGQTSFVELNLARGVRASGRVLDDAREPLSGVSVSLTAPSGSSWRRHVASFKTGPDGLFDLATLVVEGGDYVLTATARDRLDLEHSLGSFGSPADVTGLELISRAGAPIEGVVQWPDGEPAPNARVEVFDTEGKLIVAHKQLDEDGRFSVTGIPEGAFTVSAHAPMERGKRWRRSRIGKDEYGWGSVGQVQAGARLALVLEPGRDLVGAVVDDLGHPLKEFELEVAPASMDAKRAWGATSLFDVPGAGGQFQVRSLPPGRYAIAARVEGAVSSVESVEHPGAPVPLLRVSRLGSVRGRVLGPGGTPVPLAEVRGVYNGRGKGPISSTPSKLKGVTDEDGAFLFPAAPAGRLTVSVDHPDLHAASAAIEVPPGGQVTGVLLQLVEYGSIEGVFDASVGPLDGRTVTVRPAASSGLRATGVHVSVDDQGRFTALELAPGAYVVGLRGNGFRSTKLHPRVEVEPGRVSRAVFGLGMEIAVAGLVSRKGKPVAGCKVSFSGACERTTQTGPDGRFRTTLDRVGDYRVHVGDKIFEREFFEDTELDFELPTGRLVGRVSTPVGAPPQVRVMLVGQESASAYAQRVRFAPTVSTDAEGRFAIADLDAGSYVCRVMPDRSAAREGWSVALLPNVAIVEGRETEVLLELERGATIYGELLQQTEAVIVEVELVSEEGIPLLSSYIVMTAPEKSYRMHQVPRGTFRIRASAYGRQLHLSEPVSVGPGEELRVDL